MLYGYVFWISHMDMPYRYPKAMIAIGTNTTAFTSPYPKLHPKPDPDLNWHNPECCPKLTLTLTSSKALTLGFSPYPQTLTLSLTTPPTPSPR